MIALLRAESLFAEGVLLRIHHCQPKAYYAQALEGQRSGSPLHAIADDARPALEFDVEDSHVVQGEQPAIADAAPARPKKRARQANNAPAESQAELPLLESERPGEGPDVDENVAASSSDSGLPSEEMSWRVNFFSDVDCLSEVDPEPCKQPELEHPVFVDERKSSGHVAQDGEPLPERPPATPLSHDVGEAAVDILAASADASSPEPRDQVDNAEQIANDSGASGSVVILPPPAAPAGVVRRRHEDSFLWGPFRFTWSSPAKRPPHGS